MYSSPPPPNRSPSLPHHVNLRSPVELRQSPSTSDSAASPGWSGSATSPSPAKPLDRGDYSHHHHHHHHHQHHRQHDRSREPYPPPHGQPYENVAVAGGDSSIDSEITTRSVIPSKRAAQNRAAQRAFRQRRDKYVKDLERKVKEMESFPEEMERLRRENKQLRDKVAAMNRQITELTGQTPTSMMSTSSASSIGSIDIGQQQQHNAIQQHQFFAKATVTVASPPTSPRNHLIPPSLPLPTPSTAIRSIPPVPLRTPQSFTVVPAGGNNRSNGGSAPVVDQQVNKGDVWSFDNFDLEFAFDSYFQDETMPIASGGDDRILLQQQRQQQNMNSTSGQVLDNLFEMLKTRQRPQIPVQLSPPIHPRAFLPLQTASYVMPSHPSAPRHH